ncbi:MAG TPA: nucleoside 2-deoxyribosyltransferase, partial [Gammaproteobacteria bacterium]|nr:nucleoside 2-deoxyribosyltransferase [Gammaproteobacteria bacterium]
MNDSYNIYFAGELFDHKDLIGNKLLAIFIEKMSQGQYRCILPQDQDLASSTEQAIRDKLLYLLTQSDLALFNFDGSDLDSGTVVEYVMAKFLDIPSVILRTDFRKGGDQQKGDAWNLMCSFYPRTKIVELNSAIHYHKAIKDKE